MLQSKNIYRFKDKKKRPTGEVKESVYYKTFHRSKYLGDIYQYEGDWYNMIDRKIFNNKIEMCDHLFSLSKLKNEFDRNSTSLQ